MCSKHLDGNSCSFVDKAKASYIYLIYRIVKNRRRDFSAQIISCMVIVAMFPILWYATMQTHSYAHATFLTFRDLAVTFFALLCICIETINTKKEENPNE